MSPYLQQLCVVEEGNCDGFDISKESFHGAEVCELVGLLILHEIGK